VKPSCPGLRAAVRKRLADFGLEVNLACAPGELVALDLAPGAKVWRLFKAFSVIPNVEQPPRERGRPAAPGADAAAFIIDGCEPAFFASPAACRAGQPERKPCRAW